MCGEKSLTPTRMNSTAFHALSLRREPRHHEAAKGNSAKRPRHLPLVSQGVAFFQILFVTLLWAF